MRLQKEEAESQNRAMEKPSVRGQEEKEPVKEN